MKTRKKMVDLLINAEGSAFTEEHRSELMALSAATLFAAVKNADSETDLTIESMGNPVTNKEDEGNTNPLKNKRPAAAVNASEDDDDEDEDDEEDDDKKKKSSKNKKKPAANTDKIDLSSLPAEVQRIVNRAQKRESQEKSGFIKTIMANESCRFTKEFLQNMDVEELEGWAEIVSNSAAQEDDDDEDITNNSDGVPMFSKNNAPVGSNGGIKPPTGIYHPNAPRKETK
jgi:hypothetical protein